MLDKKTLITVTNRNFGHVGYTIPNMNNLRRQFSPGQSQEVTMEELRQLSYQPGGKNLLKNYLIIENKDAVSELIGKVEPEYNYTEADVRTLLLNGSVDQLLDCLDFGPNGVKELVKELAVSLEINDVQKRDAIKEKTGFNVTKAIEINHETETAQVEETKTRRSAPIESSSEEDKIQSDTPQRRVPQYKVTNVVESE